MPHVPSRSLMPLLPLALALVLTGGCSAPPSPTSPAAAGAAGQVETTTSSAATAAPEAAPDAAPQDGVVVQPDQRPSPGVEWGDATIPAGREIVAILQETIDSGTARTGTIVRAVTDAPVRVGEVVVLPRGSTFDGLLGQVIPAAEGLERGGTIALRWKLVRTPVGTAAPLKAAVGAAAAAPGGSAGLSVAGPEPVVEGNFGGTVLAAGARGEELILAKGTRLTIVLSEAVPIKVRL